MVAKAGLSPRVQVYAADWLHALGREYVVEPPAPNKALAPQHPTASIHLVPMKAAEDISKPKRLESGKYIALRRVPPQPQAAPDASLEPNTFRRVDLLGPCHNLSGRELALGCVEVAAQHGVSSSSLFREARVDRFQHLNLHPAVARPRRHMHVVQRQFSDRCHNKDGEGLLFPRHRKRNAWLVAEGITARNEEPGSARASTHF